MIILIDELQNIKTDENYQNASVFIFIILIISNVTKIVSGSNAKN
jgi:hypothetical protein